MRLPAPQVVLRLAGTLVTTVALTATPQAADQAGGPCDLPHDQRLTGFRLSEVDPSSRCLLAPLITSHTTSGTIGPLETPVGQELYEYLLDRPVITATLVERLGMGAYRFTPVSGGRYWVEDGDGTEGLLTLVSRDGRNRIYYIDGYHHGRIFSTVHATAAIFMKVEPTGHTPPHVSTWLLSFARLDDRLLSGLVWMLRPLLEGAITRKLTRGFQVTYELAVRIAEEPARILEEANSLPFESSEDAARFAALLPTPATAESAPTPGTVPLTPAP